MAASAVGALLQELYQRLWEAWGPQGWWPGDTPFEVVVGAILTQNTNWKNVAMAIKALKEQGLLEPQALHDLPVPELAQLIRPAGYYNIKARRLKNFLDFLGNHYGNSMEVMAAEDLESLRPALLAVKGIGPETADSILLYGLAKPTFVVDAYTFRILSRHGLIPETYAYEDLRQLFMEHLPLEVALFQEYHALLVRLGKLWCRPRPRCDSCPVQGWPEE
ncbi:MAG: endonuclease III domain-containing protein [Thermodesulfobacteriota bacterium]